MEAFVYGLHTLYLLTLTQHADLQFTLVSTTYFSLSILHIFSCIIYTSSGNLLQLKLSYIAWSIEWKCCIASRAQIIRLAVVTLHSIDLWKQQISVQLKLSVCDEFFINIWARVWLTVQRMIKVAMRNIVYVSMLWLQFAKFNFHFHLTFDSKPFFFGFVSPDVFFSLLLVGKLINLHRERDNTVWVSDAFVD